MADVGHLPTFEVYASAHMVRNLTSVLGATPAAVTPYDIVGHKLVLYNLDALLLIDLITPSFPDLRFALATLESSTLERRTLPAPESTPKSRACLWWETFTP